MYVDQNVVTYIENEILWLNILAFSFVAAAAAVVFYLIWYDDCKSVFYR